MEKPHVQPKNEVIKKTKDFEYQNQLLSDLENIENNLDKLFDSFEESKKEIQPILPKKEKKSVFLDLLNKKTLLVAALALLVGGEAGQYIERKGSDNDALRLKYTYHKKDLREHINMRSPDPLHYNAGLEMTIKKLDSMVRDDEKKLGIDEASSGSAK
ncbi:MAG: hypothetical protein WCO65_02130 [bacterium]